MNLGNIAMPSGNNYSNSGTPAFNPFMVRLNGGASPTWLASAANIPSGVTYIIFVNLIRVA
jgi:hypothetical protein